MNGTISLQSKLKGAVSMANTIINGGASPYPKTVGPSAIASFSDGAQDAPLKSAVVNIEPVQSGSGDPSPSNIRPISGWTQVNWHRTAVNVWDEEWEVGAISSSTGSNTESSSRIRSKNYISVVPNVGYYFVSPKNAEIFTYDASKTFIGYWTGMDSWRRIKTIPENCYYIRFVLYSNYGTTYNHDVSINYPSTDTAYHAYQGTPITIQLGQTVYGGTLDAIAGKLLSDWLDKDMGTLSWVKSGSRFYAAFAQTAADCPEETSITGVTRAVCSQYKAWDRNTIESQDSAFSIHLSGTLVYLTVVDSRYSDAATFQTAMSRVYVCYPLRNAPAAVDLTPQTIKTLLGVNNIWADAGDTTLEYYPAAASIVAVQNRSTKAYVSIPLGMIRYETYQITPQQTIDLDSYRSENGNLLRNPVATKCKLEFNTPLMTDTQWAGIWNIIKAGFNNNTERQLKLKYYDTLSASYKTGYFYVPDVQTTIRNIEEGAGVINYNEIRIAFIEY